MRQAETKAEPLVSSLQRGCSRTGRLTRKASSMSWKRSWPRGAGRSPAAQQRSASFSATGILRSTLQITKRANLGASHSVGATCSGGQEWPAPWTTVLNEKRPSPPPYLGWDEGRLCCSRDIRSGVAPELAAGRCLYPKPSVSRQIARHQARGAQRLPPSTFRAPACR